MRRLLRRYHDNPRLLKQIVPKKKRNVGALLGHAANEEFDELRAQRVSAQQLKVAATAWYSKNRLP